MVANLEPEVKNANGDHTFAAEAMRITSLAWEVLKKSEFAFLRPQDGLFLCSAPNVGMPLLQFDENPCAFRTNLNTFLRRTPVSRFGSLPNASAAIISYVEQSSNVAPPYENPCVIHEFDKDGGHNVAKSLPTIG